MDYEELINSIVKEYGNDNYNVKACLMSQICDEIFECEYNYITFLMYGKEFRIEREMTIDNSKLTEFSGPFDNVVEKWSYERLM